MIVMIFWFGVSSEKPESREDVFVPGQFTYVDKSGLERKGLLHHPAEDQRQSYYGRHCWRHSLFYSGHHFSRVHGEVCQQA